MNQDAFTWEELGQDCADAAPAAIISKLATIARVDVFMAFPDSFDHSDIALDLGMPNFGKATRDEVLAYLQQKPAASVALSARAGATAPEGNGLAVAVVARLIGLPENSSKESVRAKLREKISMMFPQFDGQRELDERMKLIGLSASVQDRALNVRHPWAGLETMQAFRGMLAGALSARPNGFGFALQCLNGVPDQQVLSLVAGMVARQRGGSTRSQADGTIRMTYGIPRKISDLN